MTTSIDTAAVVGAGYMGGGIAQTLAFAGVDVQLADANSELTMKAFERLLIEAEQFEREGLFKPGSTAILKERLRAADSIESAVGSVDFVHEAVPEVPAIKRDVLGLISRAIRSDAIAASNTSTLPISGLAEAFEDASRFLGVHYSNPAPFIPGVEVIPHAGTNETILAPVEDLLRRAGKVPARVKDSAGFVLNRLQYVLFKEAINIVEDGIASPEAIDEIVRTTFGFRLPFFGPFVIADMAGLDVYAACFKTFEEHYGERLAAPKILIDLVNQGKCGTKSGQVF